MSLGFCEKGFWDGNTFCFFSIQRFILPGAMKFFVKVKLVIAQASCKINLQSKTCNNNKVKLFRESKWVDLQYKQSYSQRLKKCKKTSGKLRKTFFKIKVKAQKKVSFVFIFYVNKCWF